MIGAPAAAAAAAAQLKFDNLKLRLLHAGQNFGLPPKWLY